MGVEGIAGSQADVLLRITLRDGRRIRHVLKAEAPSFKIDSDRGQLAFVGAGDFDPRASKRRRDRRADPRR